MFDNTAIDGKISIFVLIISIELEKLFFDNWRHFINRTIPQITIVIIQVSRLHFSVNLKICIQYSSLY